VAEVIAEIGWNHMGDMDLAQQMIKSASESGATYAKFQTWSTKRLKNGEWDQDGRREIYEKAELSIDDHIFLINKCKENNIKFLSSCFSLEDAELLRNLGQIEIKIPSMEVRNHKLINYCISEFSHIFISTGTANQIDILNLKDLLNKKSHTVMHCVSSYPCNPENANLPRIKLLKDMFNNVGYSDHVLGIDASLASLEYGTSYIEKHFTIDNELPGRDNKFAILPSHLKALTLYIKNRKLLNKDHGINFQECEKTTREEYSGRFSSN
tara:strand:- start:7750 stop:8553 length:804 start_codon:yes stop_codon:yes gene_type:complete